MYNEPSVVVRGVVVVETTEVPSRFDRGPTVKENEFLGCTKQSMAKRMENICIIVNMVASYALLLVVSHTCFMCRGCDGLFRRMLSVQLGCHLPPRGTKFKIREWVIMGSQWDWLYDWNDLARRENHGYFPSVRSTYPVFLQCTGIISQYIYLIFLV